MEVPTLRVFILTISSRVDRQFVPMCLLTCFLCSVRMDRWTRARPAIENFNLPSTRPWSDTGAFRDWFTKGPFGGTRGSNMQAQINLALLSRRLPSRLKSECSLANEKLLAFCYIIAGRGSVCCPMWMFGWQPLLIFCTKSREQSAGSFAKCRSATLLGFGRCSSFSPSSWYHSESDESLFLVNSLSPVIAVKHFIMRLN